MIRNDFDHGFSDHVWRAAKEEARQAMIAVARRGRTMSYTEPVQKIVSCHLEPRDPRLAHMLGQVSTAEDEAGRGLLTVVVVHKTGDMKPGSGFFELAERLGRDISDTDQCWVTESRKVYEVWS